MCEATCRKWFELSDLHILYLVSNYYLLHTPTCSIPLRSIPIWQPSNIGRLDEQLGHLES